MVCNVSYLQRIRLCTMSVIIYLLSLSVYNVTSQCTALILGVTLYAIFLVIQSIRLSAVLSYNL